MICRPRCVRCGALAPHTGPGLCRRCIRVTAEVEADRWLGMRGPRRPAPPVRQRGGSATRRTQSAAPQCHVGRQDRGAPEVVPEPPLVPEQPLDPEPPEPPHYCEVCLVPEVAVRPRCSLCWGPTKIEEFLRRRAATWTNVGRSQGAIILANAMAQLEEVERREGDPRTRGAFPRLVHRFADDASLDVIHDIDNDMDS